MRKKLVACIFLLPMFMGCATSDVLFWTLGDYYSAGGHTRAQKKEHYEQQIEAYKHYGS